MGNVDRNKPQSFEEMAEDYSADIQLKPTVKPEKKLNWFQRLFAK